MDSRIHRFPGPSRFTQAALLMVLTIFAAACGSSTNKITLDGGSVFDAYCSSCHTIGRGNLTGPDLKGVTDQQSTQWLEKFISNPDQVITSGDPTAQKLLQQFNYVVMPNLGLSPQQVTAVIAYIKAETGNLSPTQNVTPVVGFLAGDPENGRAIFLGDVHLENGGPFCIGCHSIDDTGLLGGGTLGPNLTEAYTKYGDVGLEGILSNLPFLTMSPIYSNHSLTGQEKADLRAFIKSAAGTPQVNKEPLIIGISLAGFAAAMLVIGFIWRNRLPPVRKGLLQRSQAERNPK
jgi:mono/diheme cytochrome c family protein